VERKSCYDGLKLPCAASFPNLQTLFAAAPILQVALGCMVRTSMAYLPLSTATPCCCPPVMLLRLWLPWPMHLGWCHKERQALFHTFALPCNACRCQEVGALCQPFMMGTGTWRRMRVIDFMMPHVGCSLPQPWLSAPRRTACSSMFATLGCTRWLACCQPCWLQLFQRAAVLPHCVCGHVVLHHPLLRAVTLQFSLGGIF